MYEVSSEPELLSIREVGERYGISRSTVHRYIRSGKLRAYRRGIGRETYVRRSELDSLSEFRPRGSRPDQSIWDQMDEFRERVFAGRTVSQGATEAIREAREEHDRERGW